MALWLWRRFKHGRPSYRRNYNRLNRYSISMQNLGERRVNHFKDETLEFKKGVKTTVVKHKDFDDDGADLSDKYRNECNSYGWVNRKIFEGHVQDVVLKVRTESGNVMSKDELQLPCLLEELGCDTTSFDPYAYTWYAPDNCVLAFYRKEDVNMIKRGKKQLLNCQWTKQHQSVSVRSKNETRSFL